MVQPRAAALPGRAAAVLALAAGCRGMIGMALLVTYGRPGPATVRSGVEPTPGVPGAGRWKAHMAGWILVFAIVAGTAALSCARRRVRWRPAAKARAGRQIGAATDSSMPALVIWRRRATRPDKPCSAFAPSRSPQFHDPGRGLYRTTW